MEEEAEFIATRVINVNGNVTLFPAGESIISFFGSSNDLTNHFILSSSFDFLLRHLN